MESMMEVKPAWDIRPMLKILRRSHKDFARYKDSECTPLLEKWRDGYVFTIRYGIEKGTCTEYRSGY